MDTFGRRALLAGGALAAMAGGVAAWRALPGADAPVPEAPPPSAAVRMQPPSAILAVTPPAALPILALTALDGSPRPLDGWRGRPVVLNFWATWCTPCVAELPALDALAAAAPDLAVLAVSADHGGAAVVRPFLASHGIVHATVLLDLHGAAGQACGVEGFPTTLLLDASGRLRGRLEGPTDWAAAAARIRALTA